MARMVIRVYGDMKEISWNTDHDCVACALHAIASLQCDTGFIVGARRVIKWCLLC